MRAVRLASLLLHETVQGARQAAQDSKGASFEFAEHVNNVIVL
jgi:hypothetical protein